MMSTSLLLLFFRFYFRKALACEPGPSHRSHLKYHLINTHTHTKVGRETENAKNSRSWAGRKMIAWVHYILYILCIYCLCAWWCAHIGIIKTSLSCIFTLVEVYVRLMPHHRKSTKKKKKQNKRNTRKKNDKMRAKKGNNRHTHTHITYIDNNYCMEY